jgi:segregation and condensation protein A
MISADDASEVDERTESQSGMAGREPGGGRFSCAVKLPAFEGPLDLLLHLIRANEVDIADIPIALISEQYVAYLELMRMLDIDVAADYLLMAATLAHIKSRLLLPPDPDLLAEDELDPRAELARRLAEYARYKEAAVQLAQRPVLGRDVFTGQADQSELPEREGTLAVSLFALVESLQRVLARTPLATAHHKVSRPRLTLQDCMVAIVDLLRAADGASLRFEDLLQIDDEPTRNRIVMSFLAVLELAKIQALMIFQHSDETGRPSGPIRVRLAQAEDDTAIALAGARAEAELAARADFDTLVQDYESRSPEDAAGAPPGDEALRDGGEEDDGGI